MGEAFIVRRGGGAKAAGGITDAVIGVIYPEGAAVTVTNGVKNYEAKDADGNTAFVVEAGTWTVTASMGEDSASETVTVAEGDFASVKLSFSLILFEDGADNTAVTGGWTATGNNVSASSVTISNGILSFQNKAATNSLNGQWFCGPVNKIDFTDYSTYAVTVDSLTASGYIGVGNAQTYTGIVGSGSAAKLEVTEPGTYELDVSALTGEYYVGWGAYYNINQNHTWTFSLFELRP